MLLVLPYSSSKLNQEVLVCKLRWDFSFYSLFILKFKNGLTVSVSCPVTFAWAVSLCCQISDLLKGMMFRTTGCDDSYPIMYSIWSFIERLGKRILYAGKLQCFGYVCRKAVVNMWGLIWVFFPLRIFVKVFINKISVLNTEHAWMLLLLPHTYKLSPSVTGKGHCHLTKQQLRSLKVTYLLCTQLHN